MKFKDQYEPITVEYLIEFEAEVKRRFEAGEINGPVHLSNGNEAQLIEIFKDIQPIDWKFSTWRSHYHALLAGIPADWLMEEIVRGKSMSINRPDHRFMTSAIVGGCLPIAVGVAAGIKRKGSTEHVWCFVGDMAATTGTYHDALKYAEGFDLPITFVVENNGKSTNTPTLETWGDCAQKHGKARTYYYKSSYPHIGAGLRDTM